MFWLIVKITVLHQNNPVVYFFSFDTALCYQNNPYWIIFNLRGLSYHSMTLCSPKYSQSGYKENNQLNLHVSQTIIIFGSTKSFWFAPKLRVGARAGLEFGVIT